MACNFSNMNTKKLKINIPEGYEIDRENSTFEEIVFKKIEDPFSELPKTWEEYCKQTKDRQSYHCNPILTHICETRFDGFYNEFFTKERVKQYVALGRLLQLRDYWVGDWKINSSSLANTYLIYNNGVREIVVAKIYGENFPLIFPTKEMAEKFKECFEDLIKKAYPLI